MSTKSPSDEIVEDVTTRPEDAGSPVATTGPEVDDAWKLLRERYQADPERFRERWRRELGAKK
jgi:hypothetical protein